MQVFPNKKLPGENLKSLEYTAVSNAAVFLSKLIGVAIRLYHAMLPFMNFGKILRVDIMDLRYRY